MRTGLIWLKKWSGGCSEQSNELRVPQKGTTFLFRWATISFSRTLFLGVNSAWYDTGPNYMLLGKGAGAPQVHEKVYNIYVNYIISIYGLTTQSVAQTTQCSIEQWIMNSNRRGRLWDINLRICLEDLRKTTTVRIVGVPAEIRTRTIRIQIRSITAWVCFLSSGCSCSSASRLSVRQLPQVCAPKTHLALPLTLPTVPCFAVKLLLPTVSTRIHHLVPHATIPTILSLC
jgi:hypothetical protein